MPEESKFTIVAFSPQKAKEIIAEIQVVMDKHEAEFYINRTVNQHGGIDTELQIVKKVALVPKEEGIPSPIKVDGNEEETTKA